jgi:hypothetical protein
MAFGIIGKWEKQDAEFCGNNHDCKSWNSLIVVNPLKNPTDFIQLRTCVDKTFKNIKKLIFFKSS